MKEQDNKLSETHSWICSPEVGHIPHTPVSRQDHVVYLRTASPARLLCDCSPSTDMEGPARLCAEF